MPIDKIDWLLAKAYPVIGSIGIAQPTLTKRPPSCPKSKAARRAVRAKACIK